MEVGNVIFALFLIVGGFSTAIALFAIELLTAKVGIGTKLMNFYNYRVKESGEDDLVRGQGWGEKGKVFKDGTKLRQRKTPSYLS